MLWIGGEWDEFALSNGGTKALANDVLATPLDTHIHDEETTKCVVEMVQAVLASHDALRIDYRCDSPEIMRRFQLTIQPMKDDRVLMVHDLRDAQYFTQPLKPWTASETAAHCKCSFCCAVSQDEGRWVRPDALGADHPAEVRYTTCPECKALIDEAVLAVRLKRKPKVTITGGFGP